MFVVFSSIYSLCSDLIAFRYLLNLAKYGTRFQERALNEDWNDQQMLI